MHLRKHNNDFDILFRNVLYSANYKLQKSIKRPQNKVLSVQGELGVIIFIQALFSPNLATLLGTPHLI